MKIALRFFCAGPSSARRALVDQPWFIVTLIVCIGSALWLAMCVAIAWIVRYRRRRKLLASNKYVNGQKPGKALSCQSSAYLTIMRPSHRRPRYLSVRSSVRLSRACR